MKNTNVEHVEWTDRLSAYLDGELEVEEFHEVESHLGECGACRRVLEELRDVISGAGGLDEMQPPRDLWAGIAATIQAPMQASSSVGGKVIALRPSALSSGGSGSGGTGERSRIALSMPQLAAASIVLIAASAVATWMVGPGLGVQTSSASSPSEVSPASAVTMAATQAELPETLAAELATLEEALVAARSKLDPNTVRVLERNLAVIERAIEDSRQALALDPGNAYLTDHLERVYQRKLSYLQDATRVAEWAG